MKYIADLNYKDTLQEFYRLLSDIHDMVLSTSAEDRVSSRVVSTACYEDTLYFMSWGHHLKCQQIARNPLVSLCQQNFQLEGRAVIKGDVLNDNNRGIVELYKTKQPTYYKMFSQYAGMVIIEVKLHRISRFGFESAKFYLDCVDLRDKTAQRLDLKQ